MTDHSPEPAAEPASPPSKGREDMFELARTIFYALMVALVIRVVLFQPYTIPSASMEPTLYQGDYIIVSKYAYGWSKHSIPFSPPLFHGRILQPAIHRGDIVVFKLPRDNSTDYIKRLIGLPGDRIQVKAGLLYINDIPVQRTQIAAGDATCPGSGVTPQVPRYRETLPGGPTFSTNSCFGAAGTADNTAQYVVPKGCYFMMGDNRDNSSDSRFDPGATPEVAAYNGCPWNSDLDQALGLAGGGEGVGFVPAENLEGRADLILFSMDPSGHGLRLNRFFRYLY